MELSTAAKESLMKVLDKSASTISEALDASGKLVKENAKELVHEIIVYEGFVDAGFGLLGALIGLGFDYWGYSYVSQNHNDYWLLYILFGVVAFFLTFWMISNIQTIVKAKVAPRLFLIGYAAGLLKSDEPEKKA